MITLSPVAELTDQHCNRAATFLPKDIRVALRDKSSGLYMFRREQEELLLLGVMPTTMLSQQATVWAMLFANVSFTLAELREGRAWMEELQHLWGYELHARVLRDSVVDTKFARFFGFTCFGRDDAFDLYVRKT